MNVLVVGGRDYLHYERLVAVMDTVLGWNDDQPFRLVTGGATGADHLAVQWAKERGLTPEQIIEIPVAKNFKERTQLGAIFDWETQGKAAGPMRNAYMLETWRPGQGVVFPGGRGTEDMLVRLFQAGVNTWVVGR
jgi:hypothetical protein